MVTTCVALGDTGGSGMITQSEESLLQLQIFYKSNISILGFLITAGHPSSTDFPDFVNKRKSGTCDRELQFSERQGILKCPEVLKMWAFISTPISLQSCKHLTSEVTR